MLAVIVPNPMGSLPRNQSRGYGPGPFIPGLPDVCMAFEKRLLAVSSRMSRPGIFDREL
jgi:hypothetical protein